MHRKIIASLFDPYEQIRESASERAHVPCESALRAYNQALKHTEIWAIRNSKSIADREIIDSKDVIEWRFQIPDEACADCEELSLDCMVILRPIAIGTIVGIEIIGVVIRWEIGIVGVVWDMGGISWGFSDMGRLDVLEAFRRSRDSVLVLLPRKGLMIEGAKKGDGGEAGVLGMGKEHLLGGGAVVGDQENCGGEDEEETKIRNQLRFDFLTTLPRYEELDDDQTSQPGDD